MLTVEDVEILEYEALSILEATYQGPLFLSAKNDQDELLNMDVNNFDEPEYAAKVQIAVKHLRELLKGL